VGDEIIEEFNQLLNNTFSVVIGFIILSHRDAVGYDEFAFQPILIMIG